ncbi:Kinase D-interacting substrate B [Araneus ventricosus]|uniref:Kinase D-interacting substrate B n=1 Tax=Araneus ventricosus TaxID=182803 RepID=A0A4Y2GY91_ARAVE|nr:Kinase D-interacting substrate B [Araneus ventricosus]
MGEHPKDTSAPFVTVLAIDPHFVIKAIESNMHKTLQKSNISGYEYLRNVVHLPFYLQSSGLRRVKAAQQAALLWNKKSGNYWNEDRECDRSGAVSSNRKASNSSMSIPDAFRKRGKSTQKLKASESMASSISNLNRVVTGAHDLNKVLLTDDYFSDINPRSMRRLMNILYITGRLLKAFNIDFNWYHLASWVNITEQWPYRTSWIIMYYEMHEKEFDEMLPLKTVFEKIKTYMPSSREQEPTLDLDHDERKFEVFLSMHSSSLTINDLKVFLPFTINLDPYIRKVIQEANQQVSEFLKSDLKPSSPPSKFEGLSMKMPVAVPNQEQAVSFAYYPQITGKDIFHHNQMSPANNFATAPPMWWNLSSGQMTPHNTFYPSSKSSSMTVLPDQEKLSTLSVNGVADLLKSQEKLNKKKLDGYIAAIEENNINGQVLLTCDLKELKETLNMSFGDWELFRILILTLREHELDNVNFISEDKSLSRNTSFKIKQAGPLKIPGNKSPEKKSTESVPKSTRASSDSSEGTVAKPRSSILEKQVTMEESMIVGALETLNEEALEDTMEEKSHMNRKPSNPPPVANPLSPILSDTEDVVSEKLETELMPVLANTPSDIDVLYMRSLQASPMLRVSAISLSDSMTDVETASLGRLQNFSTNLETPPTISRTKSEEYDSAVIPSSPRRKRESNRAKSNYAAQRPSSLVYDSNYVSAALNLKCETSNKSKNNPNPDKLSRKSQEKSNALNHVTNKLKRIRKKSTSKSESSDSSTETEEKVKPKLSSQKTLPTPGSDADGFYSDDEHTPLVSPFHLTRSSHYNLQSSKSEKESTPEKSIPKQGKSEAGPHRKMKKSLERQYSIDSNLCDHSRPPPSSSSMVEIATPSSMNQYVPVLPAYGQDVSDSSSPELVLESQVHNETVL